MSDPSDLAHTGEPHDHGDLGERANKIRAAVLGANDGIVSVAGLVVGVAGATTTYVGDRHRRYRWAGGRSVEHGVGEYVSVSSQRDTEAAAVALETHELATDPEGELQELIGLFEKRGLTRETATSVANELTAHDALAAHAREELKIEPGEYVNPWAAAVSSLLSFTVGAALPLIAILVFPQNIRIWVTFLAVAIALAVTGFFSAKLATAPIGRAVTRNVIGARRR